MHVPGRLPYAWGATTEELAARYPCDVRVAEPDVALVRAIDVHASPATTFRWLCQLRAAPYSYDWIDNRGRRSPRQLTPGLEQLALGQTFMRIFVLGAYEPGRHLTLDMKHPRAVDVFGSVSVTYCVKRAAADRSRLVVKLVLRHPRRLPWSAMRRALLWGDVVMMRKQLVTLRSLAEATERAGR